MGKAVRGRCYVSTWSTMRNDHIKIYRTSFRFGSVQTAWLRATTDCYDPVLNDKDGIWSPHDSPEACSQVELALAPDSRIHVYWYENDLYHCSKE